MGDAGEGLVDAEARYQERMDERERERTSRRSKAPSDPAAESRVKLLRLARVDLKRQVNGSQRRDLRATRMGALVELDRQLAEAEAALAEMPAAATQMASSKVRSRG